MITILIGGPQGSGKTRMAQLIIKMLIHSGFVNYKVYTTNETVNVPRGANEEQRA